MIVLGNASSTSITVITSLWYPIFTNKADFLNVSLTIFIQKRLVVFWAIRGLMAKQCKIKDGK